MVSHWDTRHELPRRPLPSPSLPQHQSSSGLEGVPRTYRQGGEEETDISGQANAGKLSRALDRSTGQLTFKAILKTCSIRRNKDSTLNGVRLLNLPAKIINWDELELSVDERHIYTSIENRMQVKFNAMLKRGTVLKHYSMVLVRQLLHSKTKADEQVMLVVCLFA